MDTHTYHKNKSLSSERVDDTYLKEHLKLTESFISRHARRMGNHTKPRAYWLDTVVSYLRELEARQIANSRSKSIKGNISKAEIIADIEQARVAFQMRKGKR